MKLKRRILGEEDGNIIIIFAFAMVAILGFVGLSIDMGLLYLRRNNLNNLCSIIREYRFAHQDRVRYADNPGKEAYLLVAEAMTDNGFDGEIQVYFYEKDPHPNSRGYVFRAQISEDFNFYFLKLFGLDTVKLRQYVDMRDEYGEGGFDRVWIPPLSNLVYNGSYTGRGSTYNFVVSDVPADLKPSGW